MFRVDFFFDLATRFTQSSQKAQFSIINDFKFMHTKIPTWVISLLAFLGTTSCTWDQLTPKLDCTVSPVQIAVTDINDTLCGETNGTFSVNASGGEPPYTYDSEVGTNSDGEFENVAAGAYTVTATDARGCTNEIEVTIQNLDGVKIDEIISVDSGCNSSNGSIEINASGGSIPYLFGLDDVTQESNIFSGLGEGTYKVTATDAKGCINEINITIENLDGVIIDEVALVNSGCNSSNGSIEITASGGSSPYLFSLGGATQESNLFVGLAKGNYTVKIQDQLGCEITQAVALSSGISYDNSIKGIIENNCAISGCHSGSVSPDFRTFSAIKSAANNIKTKTGNKSMPKGSSLSQSQIDMIACWVDDGALEN
jgi:copper chaperone CopZ